MSPGEGPVRFTLDEIAVIVEDLMRIADDLKSSGNEVNAYLLDLVVNRLLDRAFGGDSDGAKRRQSCGQSSPPQLERWVRDRLRPS